MILLFNPGINVEVITQHLHKHTERYVIGPIYQGIIEIMAPLHVHFSSPIPWHLKNVGVKGNIP